MSAQKCYICTIRVRLDWELDIKEICKKVYMTVLRIRSTRKPQYLKTAVSKTAVLKNRSLKNRSTQKPLYSKTAVLKIRSTQNPQFLKYDSYKKKITKNVDNCLKFPNHPSVFVIVHFA